MPFITSAPEPPPLRGSRFDLRMQDNAAIGEADALRLAEEGRWGFLHSEEAGSAVDGPGVRVVFWLTGCEFRCLYCHNPDTWKLKNGQLVCVDDILGEIETYRDFLRIAEGGITLSGGEPLVQSRFVMNILRGAKAMGIHTALDTNGFLGDKLSDDELEQVDLFLLDIKSRNPETHLHLTGQSVEPVLAFARRLAERRRPAWIRFVLVPGVTDDPANIEGVASFTAELGNVERAEVLPFHQLGKFKWEQLGMLGMEYALRDAPTPDAGSLEKARAIFRSFGLNCPG